MEEKVNYVDKTELYNDLCAWKKVRDAALLDGKPAPALPRSVGLAIIQITDGTARRPNFRNYTFIEEMKGDGIVDAVKAMNSFDPERKNKSGVVNPFGFISLVVWRAFLGRIAQEKKLQKIKVAAMSDPTTESYTQGEEAYDIDSSGIGQFMYENRA